MIATTIHSIPVALAIGETHMLERKRKSGDEVTKDVLNDLGRFSDINCLVTPSL